MLKVLPIKFDENPSINKQVITFVHELFEHTSYMTSSKQFFRSLLTRPTMSGKNRN